MACFPAHRPVRPKTGRYPQSVIGALVGEFVQPKSEGLGYLLVTARYRFKTDLVFVILFTLAIIALSLYGLVVLIEKRLLCAGKRKPPSCLDIMINPKELV